MALGFPATYLAALLGLLVVLGPPQGTAQSVSAQSKAERSDAPTRGGGGKKVGMEFKPQQPRSARSSEGPPLGPRNPKP
jgi:hypothetical protein